MPKTIIILADTALELIPVEIYHSKIIKRYAEKRGKLPSKLLLDSSYHYKAMRKLSDFQKRGRPDILHFCLLTILGAPLVKESPKGVRILIHTYNKELIEINPETRIPKHCNRFAGLMEQLFEKGEIKTKEKTLISLLENSTVEKEIKEYPREQRILLTSRGKLITLPSFLRKHSSEDLVLVIGGFPQGFFSREIETISETKVAITTKPLDAWTVLSRVIYEREVSILSRKTS